MSSGRKKIFLQKKRSNVFAPKDSNNTAKHRKISKGTQIKGPWTSEEDKLLLEWISQNGAKNWTKVAQCVPGRSGKQCREHWNNSLNSEIVKGNWSSEEDFLIMKFYDKFQGSWKKMIPIFKSRTENSIKNRFYSQLRKIASKFIKTGKKEYSTKFGLDTLLNYYDMGMDEAEKNYLKKHPMSANELKEYVNKIENMVKNKPKGDKFIDLDISNKDNNKNQINDDKNYIHDNNIDINESEDEFNESLKKFSKKNENMETIKKITKSKNIEEEEKNKQTLNPEESKTFEETFEVVIKDDKDKQKSKETKNNIEEKNNTNLIEKKIEIPNNINNNNNDYIINNIDKNNIQNNNNIVHNNYYNVHNTYNYNINNNNNNFNNNNSGLNNNNNFNNNNSTFSNNNNFNNNNFNNSLFNKTNYNMNNINDNNSSFATNLTSNYNSSFNNYYPFPNQRNGSNIFKQYNNLLSKKSSDLSEHIKNNDHKAIENKYNSISNLDVLKLLNTFNTQNTVCPMGSNCVEPNYVARLQSGELNAFTPAPNAMFDKKISYPNECYNYLSKRSESLDFNKNNIFRRLPSDTYGFNKMASFTSIKDKNDDCNMDVYDKKF